jgi:hypothetical protein
MNAPEGHFRNCIVTEISAWDIDGKSYPYIGIFNGRENLQLPLEKDCIPPAGLEFGSKVDFWAVVSQGQKVVGDRAVGKVGLRIKNIELSASSLSLANDYATADAA